MPKSARRTLVARQLLVTALLFGGYAACYFGRADFSVSMPLLVDELARRGIGADVAVVRLGAVYSAGVLAYALGKVLLAGLGDFWGGRRSFLLALGGATLFTLLFSAGVSLPLFTLAWVGNRLSQSIAWAGALKVIGRWFDFRSHGVVVAIVSLSYLVGDALARQSMGYLVDRSATWADLFRYAGAILAIAFLLNLWFLRESRVEAGHDAAHPNPTNLYAAESADGDRPRLGALLAPLLRSRAFALVCVLSFGSTIVREAFGVWLPVFLRDSVGYDTASAARLSAVFPAVGAVSVLLAGWGSDRIGPAGRPTLLLVGLLGTSAALGALYLLAPAVIGRPATVALVGLVAFCLIGPYTYLGGAIALDFGGARGGALASGIIDGIGYLGGTLAGVGVAKLAVHGGWQAVFVSLGAVTLLSAGAAGVLLALHGRAGRRAPSPTSGAT